MALPKRKKKIPRQNITGLVNDNRPDELSAGYFLYHYNLNPKDYVFRIFPNSTLYNGIDSLFAVEKKAVKDPRRFVKIVTDEYEIRGFTRKGQESMIAQTIPAGDANDLIAYADSDGRLSEADSDHERVDVLADTVSKYFISNAGNYPEVVRQFVYICQSKVGDSNTHLAALQMQKGDCFHRSTILTAMIRDSGIPARIVGFSPPKQNVWNDICDYLGEFKLEGDPAEFEKRVLPQYFQLCMQEEFPDFGSDATFDRDWEIVHSYLRGEKLLQLNKDNQIMRGTYCHVWVEAKVEDGWTTNDSTKLSYVKEKMPDPVMDAVVKFQKPNRVIFPEVKVFNTSESVRVRYKNPEKY